MLKSRSGQYKADHTYRVKLITDQGTVQTFDPTMPFYYGQVADESAAFYRVEVIDETTGVLTAIGNPIWND